MSRVHRDTCRLRRDRGCRGRRLRRAASRSTSAPTPTSDQHEGCNPSQRYQQRQATTTFHFCFPNQQYQSPKTLEGGALRAICASTTFCRSARIYFIEEMVSLKSIEATSSIDSNAICIEYAGALCSLRETNRLGRGRWSIGFAAQCPVR